MVTPTSTGPPGRRCRTRSSRRSRRPTAPGSGMSGARSRPVLARAAGALVYVDGVHATPHVPVDAAALGADFYTTSAYKWSGPHVAATVAAPSLLETLRPDKLAPSSDEVPERFERGTLPFADLAGVSAAVDHIAGLAGLAGVGVTGASRRERVLAWMTAVEEYEAGLVAP